MDKNAVRKSKKLLQIAKNIFGKELVKNAYVTTWKIDGDLDKEGIKKRLDDNFTEYLIDPTSTHLDYGGETIILEFTNSRKIEFSGSEWESMSLIEYELDEM